MTALLPYSALEDAARGKEAVAERRRMGSKMGGEELREGKHGGGNGGEEGKRKRKKRRRIMERGGKSESK